MSSTLVLRNARVHTLDQPEAARAIALRNGAILAVGSEEDVWSAVGSDVPSVDLGGRVVLPGFTDAHVHWAGYALLRRQLRLEPELSLPEVVKRVRTYAAEHAPSTWVRGRGWDHSDWGRWPTADDLDDAAPELPVALTRKDGHALWVNSQALRVAGIDAETEAPPGGEIVRHNGQPTGVLKENAMALVLRAIPEPDRLERQAAMVDAWPDAWCRGITGCHDMGHRDTALFRDLSTLRDAGELGLRFVWYLPRAVLDEAIGLGLRSGLGDAWLRVGGLKLFLDGTLGSQTADMLAPYAGQPDNCGLATLDFEEYCDLVRRAAAAGMATAVHAIGDAANRKALDGFATVADEGHRAWPTLRPRIEHFQLAHPDDVPRLAELGVVASMQPIHATADRKVADRYWGSRAANAYAWQRVLDGGGTLAFGSDAPIETLDVFAGLHAAVTRQDARGRPPDGWYPEQRVTVRQAIRAYTLGAAEAGGQADQLGSLATGKRADLIVLDRDPFAVAPQDLLRLRVLGTMIEGVWVWQATDVEFGGPRQTT